MSTDPGTIDLLIDSLGRRGATFTTRRMFGEYCLYRDGLPVALVCDDTLFVKDTPAGREVVAKAGTVEFGLPYPGARLHIQLSPDAWDDGDWLRRVLDVTAAALPPVKPKVPKSPASSTLVVKAGKKAGTKSASTKTATSASKKVTPTAVAAAMPASKRAASKTTAQSAATKRASKKAMPETATTKAARSNAAKKATSPRK